MRLRSLLTVAALTATLTLVAFAADVTGKWAGEAPGRGGQTRPITLELKADGSALTGAISGMQGSMTDISEGKVDGNNVSFAVVREFNGNTMKMLYKGTVSGDELKLTVTREGGDQPGREMTLKRAK